MYLAFLHILRLRRAFALLCVCVFAVGTTWAGQFVIGTNALYWATTTPNVSLEFALSPRLTLAAAAGYNNFNFRGDANPKLHHWLLMPELRLWRDCAFGGSYFGAHLFGGRYNVGGINFIHVLRRHRYDGYAFGAGLSYGRRWRLGRGWALELSAGVGYAYLNYCKFDCGSCGRRLHRGHRHYAGPTKLALSVIYRIPSHAVALPEADLPHEYDPSVPDTIRLTDTIYVAAPVETSVTLAVPDTARFEFRYPVDSSQFLVSFGQNGAELGRLYGLLASLKDGPIAVTVTGYASPEHRADYNSLLSLRRANAVADIVVGHGAQAESVVVCGAGEDTDGFLAGVAELGAEDAATVAALIAEVGAGDVFDAELRRRYPTLYARILAELYPELRRTVIEVVYQR